MRDITIIAPHPDDEIIYCWQLIKDFSNRINNIIWITSGETCVHDLVPVYKYAKYRGRECCNFVLNKLGKDVLDKSIFINLTDFYCLAHYYEPNIKTIIDRGFFNNRGISITDYIINLISINSFNIIAHPAPINEWYPTEFFHPTHRFTNELIEEAKNNFSISKFSILYGRCYFNKDLNINNKIIEINKEEKINDFATYYPSQYKSLKYSKFDENVFDNEYYVYAKEIKLW